MNYKRIHDSIIERAKSRIIDGYKERHHIVPRCIGGTDDEFNIIELTAREHYVIHQLLMKIYPHEHKLSHAANIMSISKNGNRINNRKYEWIKKRHANALSIKFSGNIYYHNPETKHVIRINPNKKPPKGYIKGRNYSPTKGTKHNRKSNGIFKNKDLQKELNKRRWDSYYKDILERNDCSSLELAIKCMTLSVQNRLCDLKNEYGVSSSVYRSLLRKHNLPTSKFNQKLFLSFNTTDKNYIKTFLFEKYNFNGGRPPFKKIREDYKYMSNHILRNILKDDHE